MIPYILYVALLISVCLLFYKLLLQKETFYRLNRVVLASCMALAFLLPLVPVPQQWALHAAQDAGQANVATATSGQVHLNANAQQSLIIPAPPVPPAQPVVTDNKVGSQQAAAGSKAAVDSPKSNWPVLSYLPLAAKWLFYLYWAGVIVFGLNLLLQLAVLLFQAYTKPAIRDGRYRIVELSGDKAPCSFGNNIFINPEKYDWETYSQILLHEKTHISQGHSFDILLAELMLVLQWFNPFAWMYRREMENNLEFLTDDSVLEHKDIEPASYQMSLLKVSAPHLSLGITTNYNQSLLKKRIIMMGAKKSNIHTMWKYFFLIPLLGGLACAFNTPAAYSKPEAKSSVAVNPVVKPAIAFHFTNDQTSGVWFATIKADKVDIEFRSDDDHHNWSSSATFKLSEFPALPRSQKGDFTLKRDAGSILFNGKFDGDEGYGHYKFTADKAFNNYLRQQGISDITDGDSFAFFVLNVTKDYLAMLHRNGYKDLTKNELISMAALKVFEAYINMWKDNGYANLTPNELVSGKALHITGGYVNEIRKAGYANLTFNQLISFKAQHITGAYISSIKKAKLKGGDSEKSDLPSANDLSGFKAMHIDSGYVHKLAAAGYKDLSYRQLTTMKALNITPEFISGYKALGFGHLSVNNLATLKSLNITPAYVKNYKAMGIGDLSVNNLATIKSLDITPEYIKSFSDLGYKNLSLNQLSSLKSLNITPEYIRNCKAMGFTDLSVNNLTTMKSLDITPAYAKGFENIGYKNMSISELASFKSLGITPEYIQGFEAMGYKNLSASDVTSFKALGIDADYIKSFSTVGYGNIPVHQLATFKSLGITPDYVKGFRDLGFKDITASQLTSLKATGVTPQYITEMRGKGFNSDDVEKYIRLKNAFN